MTDTRQSTYPKSHWDDCPKHEWKAVDSQSDNEWRHHYFLRGVGEPQMPMDDATRSRLANLLRKTGDGDLRLYAVTNHKERVAIVVVSTCSEEALKVIQEQVGLRDWTLANTATRSIQRNIDAKPGVVCAFELIDRKK